MEGEYSGCRRSRLTIGRRAVGEIPRHRHTQHLPEHRIPQLRPVLRQSDQLERVVDQREPCGRFHHQSYGLRRENRLDRGVPQQPAQSGISTGM